MATKGALGRRRDAAVARIEQRCIALGGEPLALPRRNRYGPDHLLVEQLETLADYLEQIAVATPTPAYSGMSLKELQALAGERGLDASHLRAKAAVIALLEQADVTESESEDIDG